MSVQWTHVILTASNEAQAHAYRAQIQERLDRKLLPDGARYTVLPDPEGERVGSGGATLRVLRYMAERYPGQPFTGRRILVIHSGGDSKRIPQYSSLGKLFSPVPKELPDGRCATLFDELTASVSSVPMRIREGMLVLSGDVLLSSSFWPIEDFAGGAEAFSVREPVEKGESHGVYVSDRSGSVRHFLHKQPVERLRAMGAVGTDGMVDLDTGAVLLSPEVLSALYRLISTDGVCDLVKYGAFVNGRVRLNSYGDFLYPLASASTEEQYYREETEGTDLPLVQDCRATIWRVLHPFRFKLVRLPQGWFVHTGVTDEQRRTFLQKTDGSGLCGVHAGSYPNSRTAYGTCGSLVSSGADVGAGAYLEYSWISSGAKIGEGSVISHLSLEKITIPPHTVLHGLPLKGGKYVVRIFGVRDDPKILCSEGASFLTSSLSAIADGLCVSPDIIWDANPHNLWNARLYCVCANMEAALRWAVRLYGLLSGGSVDVHMAGEWAGWERISLRESFRQADIVEILRWQTQLREAVSRHRGWEGEKTSR